LVLFGVQNTQLVTVRFLSYSVENLSVSLVIVIAAICGALLVALLNVWSGVQRTLRGRRATRERNDLEARNRDLQKRVAELERENQTLKSSAPAPQEPAQAKATTK
jgi:cell division protein FtsB